MATAFTPIAWQSLTGTASSVTFSSIPSTYRDLRLVAQFTYTGAGNVSPLIRINGDASPNYSYVSQTGDGTSPGSYSSTSASSWSPQTVYGNSTTTITFVMDFLDYSAIDKHKVSVARWNNTAIGVEEDFYRWANTSAITSFVISNSNTPTFAVGSTFALYGIAA